MRYSKSVPIARSKPTWRQAATVQVAAAEREKKAREAEAATWIAEVRARKAAKP
jgi:hypothetical protein